MYPPSTQSPPQTRLLDVYRGGRCWCLLPLLSPPSCLPVSLPWPPPAGLPVDLRASGAAVASAAAAAASQVSTGQFSDTMPIPAATAADCCHRPSPGALFCSHETPNDAVASAAPATPAELPLGGDRARLQSGHGRRRRALWGSIARAWRRGTVPAPTATRLSTASPAAPAAQRAAPSPRSPRR